MCPKCLKRIPASHVAYGKEIYLEKTCPIHGDFSSIIWRGYVSMDEWRGHMPTIKEGENKNCPHGCGLCDDHQQDSCCILLEITKACNLNCTFCFADGGIDDEIPLETIIERVKSLTVPGETLIQLSGGEPTMREDLPQIITAAKDAGCPYVQLNTNGIKLAESQVYVKNLANAGLSFVFMQFDGIDDEIYRRLRGRNLFEVKKRAIENCNSANIGVTLVPTIVPGVNNKSIGDIIRYAVDEAPAVRGVHFQPVSYFGRIPQIPTDEMRFTLDELLEEIRIQAGDIVPSGSISPSRCDHPLCGFHGDYIVMNNRSLYPLHKQRKDACCENSGYVTAEENRNFVARRWQRPAVENVRMEKDDYKGYDDDDDNDDDIETLDGFLKRVKSHCFTLTAMAFQDRGNIDLERLRRCSLHVYDQGRLVPFCAYYL